ncbi:hypothetical protein LO762_08490 [Actinocorallia sp. API 0066]|uniref:hypothetical protein n=1 Tax=Actinocorallia sp. API 0066 TaxID=2896846 RepID=UPI001E2A6DBF|nr:hypothetical protein [Actinocorallia sp. API 0066]MCD0449223.1 hypothetical protein [Actinocorallia sp. API 0066]
MTGDLLPVAVGLLNKPGQTRTVAFLLRLALEHEVDAFWLRAALPTLPRAPMRTQLLCLTAYTAPSTAARLHSLWSQLSQACHYHSYELSPTVHELHHWHHELLSLLPLPLKPPP